MKHSLFIPTLAFLLVSFVGAAMLLWPNFQEFSELQRQIKEKGGSLEQKQKRIGELTKLQEELHAHEHELRQIDAAVPQDPQMPAVYDMIQSMAASSGLVLKSILSKPALEEHPGSSLKTTQMSLSLQGSYEGIKQFLSRMKASARVLNMESIKISPAQKGAETPEDLQVLEASIEANVYSY